MTVIPISQWWKPRLRNLTTGTCVEELGSVTQSLPRAGRGPWGKKRFPVVCRRSGIRVWGHGRLGQAPPSPGLCSNTRGLSLPASKPHCPWLGCLCWGHNRECAWGQGLGPTRFGSLSGLQQPSPQPSPAAPFCGLEVLPASSSC